ncbi:hypothetical protein ACD661_12465 [Legionella lytica]|uniref:Serine/threonine-protein kinase n=1 Tax=Legionella lytica TaxID=96232 RepID=A0ABW8D9I5_9GAMM
MFSEEVKQMQGKDKSNVFALFITKLSYYSCPGQEDKQLIDSIIKNIKPYFFNHSYNFLVLEDLIKYKLSLYKLISKPLAAFLQEVVECIKNRDFKKYFEHDTIQHEDLECRVQRVFESNLAIKILSNPSKGMWKSINKISLAIISLLKKYRHQSFLNEFLDDLGPSIDSKDMPHLALAFGRFAHRPSIGEVIETLKKQDDFVQIMLIHFMFFRDAYQSIPLLKLPKNLDTYQGDFKQYLRKEWVANEDPRIFFWDYIHFSPDLYNDRGRGEFHDELSCRLGISTHDEDIEDYPQRDTSWLPDCLCQEADINSEYVKSLVARNIPYVAGASGMTSLFCGAMLFLGQFTEQEEYNCYLLNVMAFIVGGGLHSIHEVLTVPRVRLGLLEQYDLSRTKLGSYHHFFALFQEDPVIQQNIDNAWESTIIWIKKHYSQLIPIQAIEEHIDLRFNSGFNYH